MLRRLEMTYVLVSLLGACDFQVRREKTNANDDWMKSRCNPLQTRLSSLASAKYNLKVIPAGMHRQLGYLKRFAIQNSRLFIQEREKQKIHSRYLSTLSKIVFMGENIFELSSQKKFWTNLTANFA